MANEIKNDPLFTTRMTTKELLRVDNCVGRLGMKSRKQMLFFIADMTEAGVMDEMSLDWRKR